MAGHATGQLLEDTSKFCGGHETMDARGERKHASEQHAVGTLTFSRGLERMGVLGKRKNA